MKRNYPGNEEEPTTSHDTIDLRAIAVICFFKPASILFGYLLFDVLQWRTIKSFFFSGEGEGRVRRRVKKTQVTAERLAQKFGVSYTADYCN